ncbi:MAG: saccharopine dehydrogenase-like oxidoreductase [Vampirovibrionales bacterium]
MMSIRVAILGSGGLGRGMAKVLEARNGFSVIAMADSLGFAYEPNGLPTHELESLVSVSQWGDLSVETPNAIRQLLQQHGQHIDAIFMALPNLPVDFFANTVTMICDETPFEGVMVDALKRTKAVELLMPLTEKLKARNILYITGAGATPGFLTTVAAVAAQSFVKVERVNIHFGVGVANWEQYKATIREDLIHLPGFTATKVASMSDAQVMQELDNRNGLIELVNMEHADDIILELAGICDRNQVTVGGLVDTRNPQKPCSTTVTVTGVTAYGKTTSHQFVVGDDASMVDNVCGPATGFMARGVELLNQGQAGLMTSASVMPRYSAVGLTLNKRMPSLV